MITVSWQASGGAAIQFEPRYPAKGPSSHPRPIVRASIAVIRPVVGGSSIRTTPTRVRVAPPLPALTTVQPLRLAPSNAVARRLRSVIQLEIHSSRLGPTLRSRRGVTADDVMFDAVTASAKAVAAGRYFGSEYRT